jgi:hypothetical protein
MDAYRLPREVLFGMARATPTSGSSWPLPLSSSLILTLRLDKHEQELIGMLGVGRGWSVSAPLWFEGSFALSRTFLRKEGTVVQF